MKWAFGTGIPQSVSFDTSKAENPKHCPLKDYLNDMV